MARWLIYFSFLAILDARQVLDISADRIVSNQIKGETIIEGNVVIQKETDILYANKVIVRMDRDKKPSQYEAIGNVKFKIATQNARVMQGRANTIIYNAFKEEYRLIGGAQVQEEGKSNMIKGRMIVLNRKDGTASVVGDKKKPAKITFSLDEKDAK